MSAILLLGGVRSGKSRLAERLAGAFERVAYVAPGPVPDPVTDPEWAARVAEHRNRRPASWSTVETGDVPAAIRNAEAPCVLVDCLGTWVTRIVDDAGAWDDRELAERALSRATAELASALRDTTATVVLVSNEVGWGVVPGHPSGRLFRDGLGRLNQTMAGVCDRVLLVVAGRVVDLSDAATVGGLDTRTFVTPKTSAGGPEVREP